MYAIRSKPFTGIREQPQRWSSCVRNTEEFFGMTIARKFVAKQFDVKSKEMVCSPYYGSHSLQ